MKEARALLKIIKAFMEEREVVLEEEIDEEKLYQLARRHGMSNFLMDWSKRNCHLEKIKQLILEDYNRQIIKDTNQNVELERIFEHFEEAGIETLLVKGATTKEAYPQDYMRSMHDMDMMIHEGDFKRASKIMKSLGFDEFYDHEKHLVFTKKPWIIVEMHRKLIPGGEVSHEYFNDIWSLCEPYQNYKNVVRMSLEDSYVFAVIHLIRHFKFTGIEIRDVLDIYLLNEKYQKVYQWDRINEKLEEFGAKEFEENIRRIAYGWFGDEEIEAFSDVEQFILEGANVKNNVNYHIGEKKGKGAYLMRLFFPEFNVMREKYPVLKRVPILLPVTWMARIVKDIFSRETTVKNRMDTIKMIREADLEETKKIQEIYQKLGII